MGKKSRAKALRRDQDPRHGFVVEIAIGPWPAGLFWFDNPGGGRTPPVNAQRFTHHTRAGGRYRIAWSRPVTQYSERGRA